MSCEDDGGGTTGTVVETSPPVQAPVQASSLVAPTGELCFMVFQMADNDLESFIRDDLFELTQASFVKDSSTISWIYFDALNLGHPDYTGETLPNVFNADGSPLTQRFDGSRYLRWDHGLQKMVVDTQLATEQDSDNAGVLQSFVSHALTDCVARGTTEYFLALSSHGGGYAGFGADDHEPKRHRHCRRLGYQSNQSI